MIKPALAVPKKCLITDREVFNEQRKRILRHAKIVGVVGFIDLIACVRAVDYAILKMMRKL